MHLLPAFLLVFITPFIATGAAQQAPLTYGPTKLRDSGLPLGEGPIFNDALRSRIASIVKDNYITGYSVGVLRLGRSLDSDQRQETTEFAQWGNRTDTGEPVTEETIVGIGSVSKAFASAAVGLVMHDFATGRNLTSLPENIDEFTWDTKVSHLLPEEWKLMDEWASIKASVRDVLSHVTGLPRHDMAYFRNDTALAAIARMRHLRPAFELRQEWHYNNFGYILAQALVERYTRKSLPDFVEERILAPLNMTSTSYSLVRALASGHASQAFIEKHRRVPLSLPDADMPLIAGAGGVLSTAPDMLRWARLLLGGFQENGDDIVPRVVLEECMRAQAIMMSDRNTRLTYGFAWAQNDVSGIRLVAHNGGADGVSALFSLFPDHGVGIVQLANSSGKNKANTLVIREIMRAIKMTTGTHDHDLVDLTWSGMGRLHREAGLLTPGSVRQISLIRFAGTYRDPSYGDYVICAPPSEAKDSSSNDATHKCKELISAYASVENVTELSKTKLYGYMHRPGIWAKYFTLTLSADGNDGTTNETVVFDMKFTNIFPHGYGVDTQPFEQVQLVGENAHAVFSLSENSVHGFGVFGLAEKVLERERRGKSVAERAEVWFTKMQA